ncbi:DUF2254 domain-containing protein [Arenimonas alkanexedens]
MLSRLMTLVRALRQRLWAKPLAACLLSILAVALAAALDGYWQLKNPPEITAESIESLLSIMASSMLVIAIFAAGAMVSAYASTSNTASPRAFPLVLADDVSQNAYSMFIAAFIFGVVGLVALENGSFGTVGRFALFLETGLVFVLVILTFVHWVDRIARLGRLGNTIERAEEAATDTIRRRRQDPYLGGVPATGLPDGAIAVTATEVGYIRRVDIAALDDCAQAHGLLVEVVAMPGRFVATGQVLLRVQSGPAAADPDALAHLRRAFDIGHDRDFDDDPRFALVVLSEIAGRALSPAMNDPGTAIDVVGRLVRVFDQWCRTLPASPSAPPRYPRVQVPELPSASLVEDAFTAIARDGAGSIEVMCRLFKALAAIASFDDRTLAEAARHQAREALAMAQAKLPLPSQVQRVRELAKFAAD